MSSASSYFVIAFILRILKLSILNLYFWTILQLLNIRTSKIIISLVTISSWWNYDQSKTKGSDNGST